MARIAESTPIDCQEAAEIVFTKVAAVFHCSPAIAPMATVRCASSIAPFGR